MNKRETAIALLEELLRESKQEKVARKLYEKTHMPEEREAYKAIYQKHEKRWNELFEQLEALGVDWRYQDGVYVLV